ncbi:MAG: putative porin [bacterium]
MILSDMPRFISVLLLGAAFFVTFPGGASAQSGSAPAPWYERIQFGGDFRSRYEGFYQDGRETRHRGRFRLRLRIDSDVNDDTHLQIQIASGDPGTPVSTNQTLTGFFRPKPFNLDRANIRYNPTGASALTLGVGKFGSPMTRTQMLWDDDLNFEGGYEQVAWDVSDTVDVTLLALQTAVNEVSGDADSYMLGGYGEVGFAFGGHRLHVSVADYGFANVDQVAVGRATGLLNSLLTNLVERDVDENVVGLVSDFNMVDTIVEAKFDTGREDYPLRLLGEFLRNTKAASDRDTGLWFEAEYGGSRTLRTYALGYTYGRIQQEAALSPFVFSDMPGTNTELHMFNIAYIPLPNLSLDLTVHVTRRLDVDAGASNSWLTRPHVAAIVRF